MNDQTKTPKTSKIPCALACEPSRGLSVDIGLFAHHLDHCNASAEERAEYLDLIWQIVCQFADFGYGLHPLNSATQNSCGQVPESGSQAAFTAASKVDLTGHQTNQENSQAISGGTAESEAS